MYHSLFKWSLIFVFIGLYFSSSVLVHAAESKITNDNLGKKSFEHLLNVLKEYSYNGQGQRDPFEPWSSEGVRKEQPGGSKRLNLEPLERWGLDELKLLGVIWGSSKPRAMIQDPSGKVHTVRKNAKLGLNNGYVAVIREGEVVIVESFRTEKDVSYKTKVLKVRP